jgi:adenylate cyclase
MRFPLTFHSQSVARKLVVATVLALASSIVAIGARYVPGVSEAVRKLNQVFYDSLYHMRPVQDQAAGPIVIVAVDDKSLADLSGHGVGGKSYGWPWPRQFYGYMLAYFNKCGAKAVVFDMVFTEPSVYNDVSGDDAAFAKSVDKSKVPIVFASTIDSDGKPGPFAPPVQKPVFGAVNVGTDVVFRTYRPIVNGFPSLASQAAIDVGATPFTEPFQLHYYGPHKVGSGKRTYRYLSASNVLAASIPQKNTGITPEMFRGKIVMIGAITVGTFDLKASPLSSEFPGVEIHATAIQNMLFGQQVRVLRTYWAALSAFIAALAGALGVVLPRHVSLKLLFAAVVMGLLFGIATILFVSPNIRYLPLASPLIAVLLATITAFAWSYLAEGRQRKLVLKALSQYVSPEVAAQIGRDPESLKLGGERRDMTVLFTDIQGFTALSETLDEQKLTHLLNYYLDEMSALIFDNNGTLDKYIGDAIMSFWNAPLYQPNHAVLACQAALAMARREREIQPQLKEFGADGMLTRIGVNTGPMVFGNMGSTRKFNYSVLGDSVNLASRLESANKFYGSHILIAQQTAEEVKGHFVLRQLDVLRVQGKQKPMPVFEILDEGPGDADTLFRKTQYESAFACYQQQKWGEGESHLSSLIEKFPADRPAVSLLNRIAYLREHPPGPAWDGVYVATGK